MNEEVMRIKKSYSTMDNNGLGYDNLYVYPGVDPPEGYKIPKFETI